MKLENYCIEHVYYSHRRTMALQVMPNGKLVLRLPYRCTQAQAAALVCSHREWIEAQRARLQALREALPRLTLQPGACWPMGGGTVRLMPGEGRYARLQGDVLVYPTTADAPAQLVALYRRQALAMLGARLQELACSNQLQFTRLRISDAHTRWGSCSSAGTISLNWRLLLLPQELIDYVLLHELCHTLHMNHSAAFWQQMTHVCPAWHTRRSALAGYDLYLTFPGLPLVQEEARSQS